MANTWRTVGSGIVYGNGKSMLDVFNGASSARIIRVYRMYHFNNQVTAVTGVVAYMNIRRTTGSSGGTTINAIPHNNSDINLDSNTTSGTSRTASSTTSNIFRRYIYSTDEPTPGTATNDEFECLVPYAEFWNSGTDTIQPITCRATQGVDFYCGTNTTVGFADMEIEFTDAAT
jgi:hypothetical protein